MKAQVCAPLGELRPGPGVTIFHGSTCDNQSSEFSEHVRMPFELPHRWNTVQLVDKELEKTKIKSFSELASILCRINPNCIKDDFDMLERVILSLDAEKKYKNSKKSVEFYRHTFPFIVKSAVALKRVIRQRIPILKRKMNHCLFFDQEQILSLLANAFLGTFPYPRNSELTHFTLQHLFSRPCCIFRKKEHKLRSILNYFFRASNRSSKSSLKGVVSFQRRYLAPEKIPVWSNCSSTLSKLIIDNHGSLQRNGKGKLRVDFANKFLGYKTLKNGCGQEEVLFCTHPELIVSVLFTESMLDNEAVTITGAERFNRSFGEGDSFLYRGSHSDVTKFDSWGRRLNEIVAIDPIKFDPGAGLSQYSTNLIERELTKAYCGFMLNEYSNANGPIATGNWGSNTFCSDHQLKSLIQWIAASACNRELFYFTEANHRLLSFHLIAASLEKFTVAKLYRYLTHFQYSLEIDKNTNSRYNPTFTLFHWLRERLNRNTNHVVHNIE